MKKLSLYFITSLLIAFHAHGGRKIPDAIFIKGMTYFLGDTVPKSKVRTVHTIFSSPLDGTICLRAISHDEYKLVRIVCRATRFDSLVYKVTDSYEDDQGIDYAYMDNLYEIPEDKI